MNKSVIRREFLQKREHLPAQVKRQKDKKIALRLEKFPPFKKSREFFTYLSHRGEVSTDSLIQKYFGKKKIIVPKIQSRAICLYELLHPEKFEKGSFGIREPKICLPRPSRSEAKRFMSPQGESLRVWREINVALIPAIAFDGTGHRIGFGGGYFDRLLKKLHCKTRPSRSEATSLTRPKGATLIGLAYEFQMIDKVPAHAYDVPVDFIITEKRLIPCQPLRNKIRRSIKSSRQK